MALASRPLRACARAGLAGVGVGAHHGLDLFFELDQGRGSDLKLFFQLVILARQLLDLILGVRCHLVTRVSRGSSCVPEDLRLTPQHAKGVL